jgi:hypothetical protein
MRVLVKIGGGDGADDKPPDVLCELAEKGASVMAATNYTPLAVV